MKQLEHLQRTAAEKSTVIPDIPLTEVVTSDFVSKSTQKKMLEALGTVFNTTVQAVVAVDPPQVPSQSAPTLRKEVVLSSKKRKASESSTAGSGLVQFVEGPVKISQGIKVQRVVHLGSASASSQSVTSHKVVSLNNCAPVTRRVVSLSSVHGGAKRRRVC